MPEPWTRTGPRRSWLCRKRYRENARSTGLRPLGRRRGIVISDPMMTFIISKPRRPMGAKIPTSYGPAPVFDCVTHRRPYN